MSSLKSTAIYLPGILIPRVMSLAILVVMTHLLSKVEFGLMSLVITLGEMVDTSCTTWVRLALLRLGAGGAVSPNLAKVVFRVVTMTTIAGCVLSFAISHFLVDQQRSSFALALATYIFGISFLRFGLALLQVEGKSVSYSVIEIVRSLIAFSLATASTWVIGKSFIYPAMAVSLTLCVFALLAITLGVRPLRASARTYSMKDIRAFAGPLLILSVMTIAANAMDRLSLQYYFGPAALGVYAATYALARQPVDVMANAINTGGYPALVGHFERGGRNEAGVFLGEQLSFFFKFVAPAVSVLFILRNDVFSVFLPAGYREEGSTIFGFILAGAFFYNLRSCIFDNIFLVERRNEVQLKYFVFVFPASVLIAMYAVPRFGVIGGAMLFTAWTAIALMMSFLFGRQFIKIQFRREEAFRILAVCLASGGLAAAAHYALLSEPAFVRLLAGTVAAGIGFFGSLIGLHPSEARTILSGFRRRLAPG